MDDVNLMRNWHPRVQLRVMGAGVTVSDGEASLALAFESGDTIPVRFPRYGARTAMQMLTMLQVDSVAIIAEGYASAYVTLAALVEHMSVCVVVGRQLVASAAPPAIRLAVAMASGILVARPSLTFSRDEAARSLLADDEASVVHIVMRALGVARWPSLDAA